MFPSPVDEISAIECVIPVVENLAHAPSGLDGEFHKSLLLAIEFWNSQDLNFKLRFEGKTDQQKLLSTITVGWKPGDSHVGLTTLDRVNVGGIKVAARAQVDLYTEHAWCHDENEIGCLQIEDAIIHELGHAIGLDHSTSPDSIMYPEIGEFQPLKSALSQEDLKKLSILFPESGNRCLSTNGVTVWNIE